MNMHPSLDLYILRLNPFDLFEVIEFSHFYEFCGYHDIGKYMEIHGDKLQWKRGEDNLLIV